MTPEPRREVVQAGLGPESIELSALASAVGGPAAGAVVTFAGVVRNHDAGREVRAIEYVGHPDAGAILIDVAAQIAGRYPVDAVAVVHRTGELEVGEVALGAAVSSAHRGEAFAALSEIIDQVKARLPVWKRQIFPDGTHEWSGSA